MSNLFGSLKLTIVGEVGVMSFEGEPLICQYRQKIKEKAESLNAIIISDETFMFHTHEDRMKLLEYISFLETDCFFVSTNDWQKTLAVFSKSKHIKENWPVITELARKDYNGNYSFGGFNFDDSIMATNFIDTLVHNYLY